MNTKVERFIEWVNKTFEPENAKHPAAFVRRGDGRALITSESPAFYPDDPADAEFRFAGPVVDYYNEFGDGYPWIHPPVEAKASEMGVVLEWENPGAVLVTEQ